MKKFISIVLSMIMAVSVMTMATIPAFAAKQVVSPQSTTHNRVINGTVNGSTSSDVTYTPDSSDPNKVTFNYNGNGDLIGWEFPGLVEGVDYEVVSRDGDSITIRILNEDADVIANAVVEDKDGGDTTATTKKKPGKTDNGSTSPKTGAMTAAGIAVAGAGFAILAALKKDEDAE